MASTSNSASPESAFKTEKNYSYEMLRIFVAHKLFYMDIGRAKISVLNSVTDSVVNYIITVAKDSKRCDDLLSQPLPNLVEIIDALKNIGLQMDVLLETCIQTYLKPYTKKECLAKENRPGERVIFYGFLRTSTRSGKESNIASRKYTALVRNVEEFMQLEPIYSMAERDLQNMFNTKPFKPASMD